jgi:glycosyltransferase involved in cell wall biosynthesis
MRVLMVHPSLDLVGGLMTYVRDVTAFLGTCAEVEVRHVDETEAKGYATIFKPQPAFSLIRGSARLRTEVRRQLIAFKPDLVHLHSAHGKSLLEKTGLARLARRNGAKVVLHLHGPDLASEMTGKRAVLAWFYRAVWSDPGLAVVVLSERSRQFLSEKLPAARVVLLRNGVRIHPSPSVPRCDPVRIGFLGVMNGFKGELDLVEAVSRTESRNYEVLMAGDGVSREAVVRRVEALGLADRVKVLGAIQGAAKDRFFEDIDLLCLPSRSDNLPLAILEAMARARPVIASTAGGIPELVEDGVTGWLVAPGDIRGLAGAIDRAVGAPDELRALGRRGWEKAKRQYDWQLIGPEVEALYRSLCGRPGAPIRA